jgi:ACR3 family arsenite efflux pump ArsB
MRNPNSLTKHIVITTVTLLVVLVLMFIYRAQSTLENPLEINVWAKKVTMYAMVIVFFVGSLANLGLYLFDKYLR